MPDIDVSDVEKDKMRPPCYHCGEPYSATNADRHLEPVDCQPCPRCKTMPACYTCRNMYCACEVHQH
ncbi:recombination activating protein 1 [Arthrobacter cheniae]|jgi:hypothetical protein|uniref:Recombination activating protein 1 n=1 Tax=Arthrobacter cheniae TaxID=1258888 RepID=A0A3A5M753_9MICC|nr:recombination activating protein 1 [Arthrobacter cheniae]